MTNSLVDPAESYVRQSEDEPPVSAMADLRTRAQQDRDRILYSRAFHRLAGVTQVVSPDAGQTFHNRMIHSLKVAQVGRYLSEKLAHDFLTGSAKPEAPVMLNTDVVETACLAHDLGHPPFGHITEKELCGYLDRMASTEQAAEADATEQEHDPLISRKLPVRACDGFEGNAQSFRVVTALEQRKHLTHTGLDLTRRSLDAIVKYPWARGKHPIDDYENKWCFYDEDSRAREFVRPDHEDRGQSLEASIMDRADDITYAIHDTMDFFRAGLIPIPEIRNGGDAADEFAEFWCDQNDSDTPDVVARQISALLRLVALDDAYDGTRDHLAYVHGTTSLFLDRFCKRVVFDPATNTAKLDEDFEREVKLLQQLTMCFVVKSTSMAAIQSGQQAMIRRLADFHLEAATSKRHRRCFPRLVQERLALADAEADAPDRARCRVVIDYLAGLSEEACYHLHARLLGISSPTLMDATKRLIDV